MIYYFKFLVPAISPAATVITYISRLIDMAAPRAETELPIRDGDKNAATEQQIDPWDVQAAHDEHGNALAFDYVAISQYA